MANRCERCGVVAQTSTAQWIPFHTYQCEFKLILICNVDWQVGRVGVCVHAHIHEHFHGNRGAEKNYSENRGILSKLLESIVERRTHDKKRKEKLKMESENNFHVRVIFHLPHLRYRLIYYNWHSLRTLFAGILHKFY